MKGVDIEDTIGGKNSNNKDDTPRIIASIRRYIKSRVCTSISSQQIIFLPESIRYALTHNSGYISKNDIEKILSCTQYQAIGLYLTLRYLQDMTLKKQCLEEICTYVYKTNGNIYEGINDICKSFLTTRKIDSMQAYKLGYFSRIGFNTDEFFEKALRTNPLNHDTIPVISLYAGLLGLPVLAKMYPAKPVIFCDPTSGLLLGYSMPSAFFSLKEINIVDLQQCRGFAIIDDAIGSGETLKSIENILEKGHSQKPIFTHIIAMKKFVH